MSRGRRENMRDDIVYHTVDIRSESIAGIFESGKFDVINHLAAQMDGRKSMEEPICKNGQFSKVINNIYKITYC